MQNPNEDTEWNDALRNQGILPPKQKEKEINEQDILQLVDSTIQEKTVQDGRSLGKLTVDELDELEDDEDEDIIRMFREKRIQEIKAQLAKPQFGEVLEITAVNYVQEVNKAGEGVWVILHLYKQGIPMCALLNQYMTQLAAKFPTAKFIKSISTVCIPNYPDRNVPTLFVYFQGELVRQFVGADALRGTNLKIDEFEYLLGTTGAIETSIKRDPRKQIEDALMAKLGAGRRNHDYDDSDDD